MVIYFNNDYLDTATDLSIFSTTIHEMLHAYLYNLYHNNLLLSTYPQYTALNNAISNFIQDGSNINNEILKLEAHNVYVDFIDSMAESIVQYAQEKGIEGVDIIYAKNLVWGGLYDPNNNNNVFANNLSVSEQLEAKNIAINEHTNHSNAKGSNNCNDD